MNKKRSKKRINKNKSNSHLYARSIFSAALIVLSLIVANVSFFSFAKDVMLTTISKDTEFENIKTIALDGIETIKKMIKESEEKDEEMINDLPPEWFLPEI